MILLILLVVSLLVIYYGTVETFDPDDIPRYEWGNVPGLLKQVKVTGNGVWGLNKHGQLYYRRIRGDEKWKFIRSPELKLEQLTANNDYVFAVDEQGFIKRGVNAEVFQLWDDIFGDGNQVSMDNDNVYAVNDDHELKYCALPCTTTDWEVIPALLKHIASTPGGAYIWGITPDDKVVYCKQPCSGQWNTVDSDFTKFVKLDMNTKEVLGIDENNMIYRRPIDGSGIWEPLPGNLKDISLNERYIFGVNYRDNIFVQRIKD